ncbi:MAG: heme-copper oxidase subunit III [Allosphingosinicella sp.]|uniref:cytochrome c oxidase subunit 3 n=1 Tax=Allosphingosinicella sp. TaxID=2823234 RepID=UPI0039524E9D
MLQPRFTRDLATLPTHAFSHRSLTWWGIMAFFLIEGTFFILTIASYFFLWNQEQAWPPAVEPPDLLPGTLFTILLLASELPNSMLKHAAEHGKLREVRWLMILLTAIGAALLAIRAFEFPALNVYWYDNAYASILWALLFLHTTHILTDWVDTLVLTALMHTRHGMEGRRFVDVSENALYWRFVWLAWLPIYVLIYWVPRWFVST